MTDPTELSPSKDFATLDEKRRRDFANNPGQTNSGTDEIAPELEEEEESGTDSEED